MAIEIEMDGVSEYCEGMPVMLTYAFKNGRPVVRALNSGGYDSTEVDLAELLEWVKTNCPDLYKAGNPNR